MTHPHPHIKSFVLRQGRMTPAQTRAYDEHWSRYGIDYSGQPRDFPALFGRAAPLVLEIGFGNGEQLLFAAQHETTRNFIGVEVHRPGVGFLLHRAHAADLQNLRVYQHDVVDVLTHEIGVGQLDEIRIYFPDPWPKIRQRKRRMIQPDFVTLALSRLASGGRLHLATDWADYAEQMLAVCDGSADLQNEAGKGQYSPCPPWRSETRFERRGKRLGHGVWDLVYRRS